MRKHLCKDLNSIANSKAIEELLWLIPTLITYENPPALYVPIFTVADPNWVPGTVLSREIDSHRTKCHLISSLIRFKSVVWA